MNVWDHYVGAMPWLKERTVFLTRHGSMAYGTNIEGSDVDVKGVFLAPKAQVLGFLDKTVNVQGGNWKDLDCALVEFREYVKLAADNNPNVIELLFVDPSDCLYITPAWEKLLAIRDSFLSTNVKNRYAGYAIAQLKKINSHRAWLLNPPKKKPEREDFGLTQQVVIPKEQREVYEAMMTKVVEGWRVDLSMLDEGTRIDVLNKLADSLVDMKLSAEDQYVAAGNKLGLSGEAMELLKKERAYRQAVTHYAQYETWKKERNAKRSELEAKFGFDTKHALHLVRLMRQAKEILATGKLLVRRPDAEELKSIRAGAWSYERLMEWATTAEAELNEVVKTSPLPRYPDRNRINEVVTEVMAEYLDKNP